MRAVVHVPDRPPSIGARVEPPTDRAAPTSSTEGGGALRRARAVGHGRGVDDDWLSHLPGELIGLADVRRTGRDVRVLYRAERRGLLVRVRPGVFVRADRWSGLWPQERHALTVRAAARTVRTGVFSHASAAAVWGVPLVETPRTVHVSVPWSGGGASSPGITRHTVRGEVASVESDGVLVTPVLDTVLDLAMSAPFSHAAVAADHGVRTGLVDRERLVAAPEGRRSRPGGRRAVAVARFADARAESPGESLSRAVMHEAGLPAPELQVRLADRRGEIGRVDFWWPALRVVGEFDGRVKYRVDGVADQRRLEERVWAEKRREDRLRAAGLGVARWVWDDACTPARLVDVLARAGVRATR